MCIECGVLAECCSVPLHFIAVSANGKHHRQYKIHVCRQSSSPKILLIQFVINEISYFVSIFFFSFSKRLEQSELGERMAVFVSFHIWSRVVKSIRPYFIFYYFLFLKKWENVTLATFNTCRSRAAVVWTICKRGQIVTNWIARITCTSLCHINWIYLGKLHGTCATGEVSSSSLLLNHLKQPDRIMLANGSANTSSLSRRRRPSAASNAFISIWSANPSNRQVLCRPTSMCNRTEIGNILKAQRIVTIVARAFEQLPQVAFHVPPSSMYHVPVGFKLKSNNSKVV